MCWTFCNYHLCYVMLLQEEKEKIKTAASNGDLNTLQLLHKEGVDVTGVAGDVSMYVVQLMRFRNVLFVWLQWGIPYSSLDNQSFTPYVNNLNYMLQLQF